MSMILLYTVCVGNYIDKCKRLISSVDQSVNIVVFTDNTKYFEDYKNVKAIFTENEGKHFDYLLKYKCLIKLFDIIDPNSIIIYMDCDCFFELCTNINCAENIFINDGIYLNYRPSCVGMLTTLHHTIKPILEQKIKIYYSEYNFSDYIVPYELFFLIKCNNGLIEKLKDSLTKIISVSQKNNLHSYCEGIELGIVIKDTNIDFNLWRPSYYNGFFIHLKTELKNGSIVNAIW